MYDEHKHEHERPAEGRIWVSNTCQPADATVLTPDGIRTIGDVDVGSLIWSGKTWTKITRKIATGVKPVAWYHTAAGSFLGTAEHYVSCCGKYMPVQHARTIDTAVCDWRNDQQTPWPVEYPRAFFAGAVLGSNDDEDLDVEIVRLARCLEIDLGLIRTVMTTSGEKTVPNEFLFGSRGVVQMFLCGLCSASGRLIDAAVLLSLVSRGAVLRVQQMLSFVGLDSHCIAERDIPRATEADPIGCGYKIFINESADCAFIERVGFLQQYKTVQLRAAAAAKAAITREGVARFLETFRERIAQTPGAECPAESVTPQSAPSYAIREMQPVGEASVFNLTLEAEEHSYWTGGLLVSNCS